MHGFNGRLIVHAYRMQAADVTIAVVGLDGDDEGEGRDRANTTLIGAQTQLLQVNPTRLQSFDNSCMLRANYLRCKVLTHAHTCRHLPPAVAASAAARALHCHFF